MSSTIEIEQRALALPEQAKTLEITSAQDFERAGEVLLAIKDLRREIDAVFDPVVSQAWKAHKEAVCAKKKVEAPLAEAEEILKPRISAWMAQEAANRRETEKSLADDIALNLAALAAKNGDAQKAEAILNGQGPAIAPVILPPAAKVAGISTRDNWAAEVTDFRALIRAVADGKWPSNLLQPDQTALNNMAKSLRGELNIPGVRAVCNKIVSVNPSGRRA